MENEPIQVRIVRYADRSHLLLRYEDPTTGKRKTRSARTTNLREAERAAAAWQAELRSGSARKVDRITWSEFRERYELEKLASLSSHTVSSTATAFNHLEKIIDPKNLQVLNEETLSRFQAALRTTGIAETSIATHLRHLRAALGWAVQMKILSSLPRIAMPKRAKTRKLMRGRPLTAAEFQGMLDTVAAVRKSDPQVWQHFLNGLWLSGLRLMESLILSWDDESPFAVDLSGRRPRFRIYGEAEKGGKDRYLPMAPDFAELLLQTTPRERYGFVFPLTGDRRQQYGVATVGRIVSEIGEKAGVIVNAGKEKYASAHDLRRSFGTRWAGKVKPALLQLLMRHESVETTMKYYVDQDADDVSDQLWEQHTQERANAVLKLKSGAESPNASTDAMQ